MKKLLMILVLLLLLVGCQQRDISVVLNPGYDIIGVNEEWIDEGCTLNINSDYSIDMGVDLSNLDLAVPGEYIVHYEEEYANTEYECIRIVKVVDAIAPVVTLNEGVDTVALGETWIDSGVNATDNFNTELTIVIDGSVNINVAGSYEITYTVTDDAENETIVIRIINVIE